MEDNFLTQLVTEPTRVDALLNLLFMNTEGLASDMMTGAFLGHSNHEITEFSILEKVPAELPLISGGQTLVRFGDWLKGSLGDSSKRQGKLKV